ncbi:MAG TPA: acyl-CoA dehydrogenase family protein, partial [Kineobactrum sp.]
MSVIGNTTLAFSEEQAMILDVAREFCRDQSDIAAVRAQLESPSGFSPEVWQQMVALGWTGIALPERVGGAGLGMAAVVPVLEAMGRSLLGGPLMSATLAGQLVLRAQ